MKLVGKIKVSDYQTMAIYAIDPSLAEKYGGPFVLTRGVFSDFALKEIGEENLMAEISNGYYEGFFQTQKEAYLTAKLVAASNELERVKAAIDPLKDFKIGDISW